MRISRNFILQNFPFLEDDFDALTDYQLFSKMVAYMRKSLEKLDVFDEELKAFEKQLDEYEEYFKNLDVQEEIDNKLDDMAEHGQLADLIAQYLDLAGVLVYNDIVELKSAENIVNGSICYCLGYDNYKDGFGSYYKIRYKEESDVIDNVNIIELEVSELLIAEKVNSTLATSYAIANHFGVGNSTYTSKSAWTGTVASIRANRQSTQPDELIAAPTNFAPASSRDSSLYRSRDSVALYIGNQSKNSDFVQADSQSITYGEDYVTYFNDVDVPYFKIGAVIDTNHSNPLSAIIRSVDTENKRIYVEDGWYYNGVKNDNPTNGVGYKIGKVTKAWGINQTVLLVADHETKNGVGQEIGLINQNPDTTPSQMIGVDVVTQGAGKGDIGFFARTGDSQYDSPVTIGKLRKGFVARGTQEGFVSQSSDDGDYLLISKKLDDSHDYTRFYVKNNGEMTNPRVIASNITTASQLPNSNIKVWLFIPSADLAYNLPDVSNPDFVTYDNRIFILCNRSEHNIILSNGYTIQPWKSVTYLVHGVWVKIAEG